jgi:hypothetical protein
MQFFMLEWWSQEQGRYNQEYFRSMEALSAMFIMLRDNVVASNPEVIMLRDNVVASNPEVTTCLMGD